MNESLKPFGSLWPQELDSWFRAILRQRPLPLPIVPAAIWSDWLAAVHHHRLGPLLYGWLRTRTLPPAVQQGLQADFAASMGNTTFRWSEATRVLTLLQQANLHPILLKGCAMAEYYYTSPYLRPSTDIDILLPEKEYTTAKAIMLANGYMPHIEVQTAARQWKNQEAFISPHAAHERGFFIELHWSLLPHRQLVPDTITPALFHRAQHPTNTVALLHPADALLHTCFHALYGHPEDIQLIWLYDIHLLVQHIEDWTQLLQMSQQWLARLALIEALSLAQSWFGTTFPAIVTDLHHYPPSPAEQTIRNLAHIRRQRGAKDAKLEQDMLRLGQFTVWQQLVFVKNRLLPGRDALDKGYPQFSDWPLPLAYLGRFTLFLQRQFQRRKPRG
ncbi:MAG: nucleotidyltransferase family protein [Ardenticatenaceae bacterium]|nr:nucleotidyltransferase family protein [Ardenticatenaceae bacterium]